MRSLVGQTSAITHDNPINLSLIFAQWSNHLARLSKARNHPFVAHAFRESSRLSSFPKNAMIRLIALATLLAIVSLGNAQFVGFSYEVETTFSPNLPSDDPLAELAIPPCLRMKLFHHPGVCRV